MNLSKIENVQPEQEPNNEQKAELLPSAQVSANAVLPAVPFRAKDKTNSAYSVVVVTKVFNESVLAHTTFADGYRKYERLIPIKDIELIPEHICNPDSFNKHCQTCGVYCG